MTSLDTVKKIKLSLFFWCWLSDSTFLCSKHAQDPRIFEILLDFLRKKKANHQSIFNSTLRNLLQMAYGRPCHLSDCTHLLTTPKMLTVTAVSPKPFQFCSLLDFLGTGIFYFYTNYKLNAIENLRMSSVK